MPEETIKLISLNLWGGRLFDQLSDFLRKRRDETDIFCFQEVPMSEESGEWEMGLRLNLLSELELILSDFDRFVFSVPEKRRFEWKEFDFPFGIAIFVRKKLRVDGVAGFLTYPENSSFAKSENKTPTGMFLHLRVTTRKSEYTIGNVHGIFLQGTGKEDTIDRIEQSRRLVEFYRNRGKKTLLCGDFNLHPQTESIAMLGREMRNLIKGYDIELGRSELYRDMEKWRDPVADYIFTSTDIKIQDFKVLGDIASDHLPLFVEFS